ncbi:uncharacterized protein LOC116275889 isoform X3 [Papio anubis]|uniref:uncharacterized protein LOC116275889 isoform X3 n=1 Tax=Papio anubis TaxID=9555 RepID=UPI0012AD79C3|nr:uncharacterized protein LOC116275889 isoform X3 [Papio anubis]
MLPRDVPFCYKRSVASFTDVYILHRTLSYGRLPPEGISFTLSGKDCSEEHPLVLPQRQVLPHRQAAVNLTHPVSLQPLFKDAILKRLWRKKTLYSVVQGETDTAQLPGTENVASSPLYHQCLRKPSLVKSSNNFKETSGKREGLESDPPLQRIGVVESMALLFESERN